MSAVAKLRAAVGGRFVSEGAKLRKLQEQLGDLEKEKAAAARDGAEQLRDV